MNNIQKLEFVVDHDLTFKKIIIDGIILTCDCNVTVSRDGTAVITIKADTVELVRE